MQQLRMNYSSGVPFRHEEEKNSLLRADGAVIDLSKNDFTLFVENFRGLML